MNRVSNKGIVLYYVLGGVYLLVAVPVTLFILFVKLPLFSKDWSREVTHRPKTLLA